MNQPKSRMPGVKALPFLLLLLLAIAPAPAATDPFLQLSSPILTNGQVHFTLTGESGVCYVIESSTNAQIWTPVVTNSDYSITRLITLPSVSSPGFCRAWRYPLPRFPGAITAKQNISLQGNNVHIDSYDSADPIKSTNGQYDFAKAQANGDIASELGLINVGNAGINGRLRVGQNGSYSLGTNGLVGPIGWTGPGIYSPDWVSNDFRFALPTVAPPFSSGFALPGGSGTNGMVFLGDADYLVNGDLRTVGTPKTILIAGGNVRLYVTRDFLLGNGWEIKIEPGSTFKLYVGQPTGAGARAEFGNVNTSAGTDATAFQYYGLASNTSVSWIGNNASKGIVYAPQATFTTGGGGNSVYDYQGAIVADSMIMNGHFNFHFDENLKRNGPMR